MPYKLEAWLKANSEKNRRKREAALKRMLESTDKSLSTPRAKRKYGKGITGESKP